MSGRVVCTRRTGRPCTGRMTSTRCQWTRSLTRLLNPNRYESRAPALGWFLPGPLLNLSQPDPLEPVHALGLPAVLPGPLALPVADLDRDASPPARHAIPSTTAAG